ESIHVAYAGTPLHSKMRAYWKVRVWDEENRPSPWSQTSSWSMGLLSPSDWGAKWISDATPPPPFTPAHNGYHSDLADSADKAKWAAIDLGDAAKIDAVKLYPAKPFDWKKSEPGFLYPVRFKIEISDKDDFSESKTVVDKTDEDVANPGTEPQTYQ